MFFLFGLLEYRLSLQSRSFLALSPGLLRRFYSLLPDPVSDTVLGIALIAHNFINDSGIENVPDGHLMQGGAQLPALVLRVEEGGDLLLAERLAFLLDALNFELRKLRFLDKLLLLVLKAPLLALLVWLLHFLFHYQ